MVLRVVEVNPEQWNERILRADLQLRVMTSQLEYRFVTRRSLVAATVGCERVLGDEGTDNGSP